MHVCQDGDARAKPVVLLHGACGSVHWFDRLTPFLASDFRVVRIDLLGHGCTGGTTGLDAVSQGRVLADLLARLDLTGAAVAGHSYGADVALALAARSDRVRELVLIGQAPDYSYADFPFGAAFLLDAMSAFARGFAHRSITRGVARFLPPVLFDDPLQGMLDRAVTAPGMTRHISVSRRRALTDRPLDTQLRDLGLPSLVILGERDRYYDWVRTRARYEAVGARVEVVADAGHSPFLTRPRVVAGLIEAFLGVRCPGG